MKKVVLLLAVFILLGCEVNNIGNIDESKIFKKYFKHILYAENNQIYLENVDGNTHFNIKNDELYESGLIFSLCYHYDRKNNYISYIIPDEQYNSMTESEIRIWDLNTNQHIPVCKQKGLYVFHYADYKCYVYNFNKSIGSGIVVRMTNENGNFIAKLTNSNIENKEKIVQLFNQKLGDYHPYTVYAFINNSEVILWDRLDKYIKFNLDEQKFNEIQKNEAEKYNKYAVEQNGYSIKKYDSTLLNIPITSFISWNPEETAFVFLSKNKHTDEFGFFIYDIVNKQILELPYGEKYNNNPLLFIWD